MTEPCDLLKMFQNKKGDSTCQTSPRSLVEWQLGRSAWPCYVPPHCDQAFISHHGAIFEEGGNLLTSVDPARVYDLAPGRRMRNSSCRLTSKKSQSLSMEVMLLSKLLLTARSWRFKCLCCDFVPHSSCLPREVLHNSGLM